MNRNSISLSDRRGVAAGDIAQAGAAQAHLVFEVDSELYACPIGDIERLMRCVDADIRNFTSGNNAQWEVGHLVDANSGFEIPIVSLRALWNLPPKNGQADREALLVVRIAGQPVALLVDACLSVLPRLTDGTRFDFPAPVLGDRGKFFQSAVARQDTLLVILQIQNLLPDDRALSPRRIESPVPS